MNMIKIVVCVFAIELVGFVIGADKTIGVAPPPTMTAAQFEKAKYKKTGGQVKVPGVQKGKIVVINSVEKSIDQCLQDITADCSKKIRIDVVVEAGSFDLFNPTIKGEATLFVIDDAKLPMSLIAPEAKWAMLNVASLKHDKQQYYSARIKKEFLRTFACLCGGCGSQFDPTIVDCITKPEQLDEHVSISLPLDVLQRIPKYLKGYGIVPYQTVSYRKACIDGWASKPTNDVQQVIWDQVHSIPTKPIQIKP